MRAVLADRFTRVYHDRSYRHSAVVNHRGIVIAFAMDDNRRIHYSILDLESAQNLGDELDVDAWFDDPVELLFPPEVVQAGFGSIDAVAMPTVRKGRKTEVERGSIEPDLIDDFLSSTARLGDDTAFQVLSDGMHIYVFRQAVASDHPDAVNKLARGGASADPTADVIRDSDGKAVPVVDRTLLVDRYLLSGSTLVNPRDVRFRRSRNATRPASRTDVLGSTDMEGNPFLEPTRELDFVGPLTQGRFAALLLPTVVSDVLRWQFFYEDTHSNELVGLNLGRDRKGWFDRDTPVDSDTDDRSDADDDGASAATAPATFRLKFGEHNLTGGIAAQYYHEQEELPGPGPIRHGAMHGRVLLCCVVTADPAVAQADPDHETAPDHIAALDFAVAADGRLTAIPGAAPDADVELPPLWVYKDGSGTQQRDVSAAEVARLNASVVETTIEIAQLEQSLSLAAGDPVGPKRDELNAELAKLDAGNQRLSALTSDIAAAQTTYDAAHKTRTVTAYADKDYKGQSLTWSEGGGDSNMHETHFPSSRPWAKYWYDEISSISVEAGALAQVWTRSQYRGTSTVLTSSQRRLSDIDFNDDIDSVKVSCTTALTNERTAAASQLQKLKDERATLTTDATRHDSIESGLAQVKELVDARARRESTRAELQRLVDGMSTHLDVIEMPARAAERPGLSVTYAHLGFAQTNAQPHLLLSALGRLKLYFSGLDGTFLAAHYDIRTSPWRATLATGFGQSVTATAPTDTGYIPPTWITIGPSTDPDRCVITFTGSDDLQLADFPRSAAAFTTEVNEVLKQGYDAYDVVPPFVLDASGVDDDDTIVDGDARIVVARRPRWIPDHPGLAIAFDGQRIASASVTDALTSPDDLTLEAWVRPHATAGASTLLHVPAGDHGYGLGFAPSPTPSALPMVGRGGITVPSAQAADLERGLTIEAWVRLSDLAGTNPILVGGGDSGSGGLEFGLVDGKPFCKFAPSQTLTADRAVIAGEWTHVAVTWRTNGPRTLFLNGHRVGTDTGAQTLTASGSIRLGTNSTDSFSGELDRVRLWSSGRSEREVMATRTVWLGIEARDLVGSWTFVGNDARDFSGNGHHGNLSDDLLDVQLADGPWPLPVWQATVGSRRIIAKEPVSTGTWQHVAAVFDQSHALRFDGTATSDAGRSPTLDLADNLTIEAVVRLDALGPKQGIVGKGDPAAEDSHVPFALHVDGEGRLIFTHGDSEGTVEHRCSEEQLRLEAGKVHRIAVIRRVGQERVESREQQSFDIPSVSGDGSSEPTTTSRQFDVVTAVTQQHFDEIQFVVDGHKSRIVRRDRGTNRGNEAPVSIGRTRTLSGDVTQLNGELCELRLWQAARAASDAGKPAGKAEGGLVAWWQMDEGGGHVANDRVGTNHAILHGVTWADSPDPSGPHFELLVNGTPAPTTRESLPSPLAGDRASIGARFEPSHPDKPVDGFRGELDEVRIWKKARTQEQLLDQMFGRLRGGRRDLIAGWCFDTDDEDTDTGAVPTAVLDSGPLANDLSFPDDTTFQPRFGLSTAPISTDTAEVRQAISGIATEFQRTVDGRVGVAEYADLEQLPDGTLTGIQKRSYVSTQGGEWHVTAGYEVGDLATEWDGQAQFKPQILGYIEGAPPVPGENLTETNLGFETATGSSEVTLVDVDDVVLTTSTSKQESYRTGFEGEASIGSQGKLSVITAPLGLGVSEEMEYDVSANMKIGVETGGTWGGSESSSSGTSVTRSSSAALGGRWDTSDSEKWENPDLTLRFKPANTGFAYVHSATADLYALRLRHTGTVVAMRLIPNTDVPSDVNVIPFKMNPHYVKQGTLDGTVGWMRHSPGSDNWIPCPDPDHPNATAGGEHSYFKPADAYARKRQIEREEQEARAFFDSFETMPAGARMLNKLRPSLTMLAGGAGALAAVGAGAGLPIAAGATLAAGVGTTIASAVQYAAKDDDLIKKFAARDLVNTYVWTAKGGFYAETTEVSRVRSSSTTGDYELSGSAAGGFTAAVTGPAAFSLGLTGSLTGAIHTTRSTDKEATETFGLDVVLDIPRDLQGYSYDDGASPGDGASGHYDAQGRPVDQIGKVDAYRFMTFYLEPRRSNFEDLFDQVVDPRWLQERSPNAAALMEANQSDKSPTCWRVMHRVTFVSRVLPEVDANLVPNGSGVRRALDISSDYELVRRLEPAVKSHINDVSAFERAVRDAIATTLPEMSSPDDIEAITQVLATYFDVDRT